MNLRRIMIQVMACFIYKLSVRIINYPSSFFPNDSLFENFALFMNGLWKICIVASLWQVFIIYHPSKSRSPYNMRLLVKRCLSPHLLKHLYSTSGSNGIVIMIKLHVLCQLPWLLAFFPSSVKCDAVTFKVIQSLEQEYRRITSLYFNLKKSKRGY